jgi:hypothetical protein
MQGAAAAAAAAAGISVTGSGTCSTQQQLFLAYNEPLPLLLLLLLSLMTALNCQQHCVTDYNSREMSLRVCHSCCIFLLVLGVPLASVTLYCCLSLSVTLCTWSNSSKHILQ